MLSQAPVQGARAAVVILPVPAFHNLCVRSHTAIMTARANPCVKGWFDCLVGCVLAASVQGAVLFGTDVKDPPKHQRMRLSEIQRGKG